jgi:hypothetical protein
MKRTTLGLVAACLLGAAAAFSNQGKPTAPPAAELSARREARNPWTRLNLNNDPDEFQFVVVSDRTGGHRPGVFSRAVERVNLLQPEFVLSVGDLVEGGTKTEPQIAAEWQEFDGYAKRFQMPFFYVPGNHDTGNAANDKYWAGRYGRRYYHFVYKDVLFLCLNTDDPPGSGVGHFGKEQIDYAKKVLAENRGVRWTVVAMHKPVWNAANLKETGWLDIEDALADRPYTVFVGHLHRYQKYVRNGRNYYQLSTTGGSSKMRGLGFGEFDHVVWVTMKKTGPVLANVLLDAILPDDLVPPASDEAGVSTASRLPTHPVRGRVFIEGAPAAGAVVVLHGTNPKTKRELRADGVAEADGTFVLTTYKAYDGVPEGEYAVTVVLRKPFYDAAGRPGPNLLPAKYANVDTSGLKYTVKAGANDVTLELRK